MRRITKKAFVEYLNHLPHSTPFCKENNCPLTQYHADNFPLKPKLFIGSTSHGYNDEEGIKNPKWMVGFIDFIDQRRTGHWNIVTPKDCIEALELAKRGF